MNNKNYYEILGLTDEEKKLQGEEFKKVLKAKYRKLAVKWHPDKHKEEDKAKAEEMFKEISEAYSVLNDDEKRLSYDNPTMNHDFHFNSSSDIDLDEILRQAFGNTGFNPFGSQRAKTVRPINVQLDLTLEELYNGATKEITFEREEPCPECKGKGYDKNGHKDPCPHCGGTGQILRNSTFGQVISPCPNCKGTGEVIVNPCPHCGGKGVVKKTAKQSVNIPKGVFGGAELNVDGVGNIGKNGKKGNLKIIINEIEHDDFMHINNDLITKIDVSVPDILLGCEKTITTISGKKLKVKIPPCTESGSKFRFNGMGMPIYGSNMHGNMIGIVNIKMPEKLSHEEKEIIKSLKTKEHFSD